MWAVLNFPPKNVTYDLIIQNTRSCMYFLRKLGLSLTKPMMVFITPISILSSCFLIFFSYKMTTQKTPLVLPLYIFYYLFRFIFITYNISRYHLAQYPLSSWVYDRYEIGYYTKLLMEGLAHYIGGEYISHNYTGNRYINVVFLEYIPKDPVNLSYWFVQNYQLSHDERLQILKLNSPLERLKLEYKYLKMVSRKLY